jgi:hypothetical protein
MSVPAEAGGGGLDGEDESLGVPYGVAELGVCGGGEVAGEPELPRGGGGLVRVLQRGVGLHDVRVPGAGCRVPGAGCRVPGGGGVGPEGHQLAAYVGNVQPDALGPREAVQGRVLLGLAVDGDCPGVGAPPGLGVVADAGIGPCR